MKSIRVNNTSKSPMSKLFFVVFTLLILINPLPLGSNRIWAWSLEATLATGLISVMVLISLISKDSVSWHRLSRMKVEFTLIILWLIINVLYLIPLPIALLDFISPKIAEAYNQLNMTYGYLSLDVRSSFLTLMLSIYYFLIFVLGVVLINSRPRIIIIMSIIMMLGVFEAVYGMYLVSIEKTGTLVQIVTVSAYNASGTFINKNHLVAFLSMCFIIGIGLRMILTRQYDNYSQLIMKVKWIRFLSHPLRLIDLGLFLILAGIWNTHSRAGLASFVFSILFMLVLIYSTKKIKLKEKYKTFNAKNLIVFVVLFMLFLVFVADDLNYFLNILGQNAENSTEFVMNTAKERILAIEQVFDNFHHYWFSGVGPGSYQSFFVNHRSIDQISFFDHAHNDYVEFIIEYGVLSMILCILIILFLYKIFSFILKISGSFNRIVGICAISCIIYMLLHANMDFNARIPANMVLLLTVISMIYGKIVMLGIKIKK